MKLPPIHPVQYLGLSLLLASRVGENHTHNARLRTAAVYASEVGGLPGKQSKTDEITPPTAAAAETRQFSCELEC